MADLSTIKESLEEFKGLADVFSPNDLAEARGKVLLNLAGLVRSGEVRLRAAVESLKKFLAAGLITDSEYKQAARTALHASAGKSAAPSVPVALSSLSGGGGGGGGGSGGGSGGSFSGGSSSSAGGSGLSVGAASTEVPPLAGGAAATSLAFPASAAAAAAASANSAGVKGGSKGGADGSGYIEPVFVNGDNKAGFYNAAKEIEYASIPLALRERYPLEVIPGWQVDKRRGAGYSGVYSPSAEGKTKLKRRRLFAASLNGKGLGAFSDVKTAAFAVACASADSSRFMHYCESPRAGRRELAVCSSVLYSCHFSLTRRTRDSRDPRPVPEQPYRKLASCSPPPRPARHVVSLLLD